MTTLFKSKKQKQLLMTDCYKSKSQNKNSAASFYKPAYDYKETRRFLNNHRNRYEAVITKKGYCYRASGDFSDFQVVTTKDGYQCINEKEIFIPAGTEIARAIVDENSALEHISVESLFRRQGIGKTLILFINKHVPKFVVFGGTEHNSRYRLTEEGAALIHACERAKILKYDQIIESTVPPSPSIMSPYRI